MWFFLIFLSVYGWANYFVIRRFLAVLPACTEPFRIFILIALVVCSISYIAAKLLLVRYSNYFYDTVLWIGSFWFAILLYSLLFLLLVDSYKLARFVIRYISHSGIVIPFIPPTIIFIAWIVIVTGFVAYGYWNANTIKTKLISISIPHKTKAGTFLKVLFLSDVHATPVNDGRIFDSILRVSNETKPDLILMGGDIVDDKSNQLYRIGIHKKLQELSAPLGIYTCPGNHEYITGKEDTFAFLTNSGVHVLSDSVVTIKDIIQLIGRDDSRKRKSLEALKAQTSDALPIILLDHQPFHLEQAEQFGIDLQLSGHTHHGQMFPFNWITKKIYEVSWGYKQKGNTQYYVSSGAGTWGPPVRVGSNSEIILFTITFTEPKK